MVADDLSDAALAARLAAAAGDALLALRDGGQFAGAALGAEGDRIADRLIVEALRAARPGDAILSEECADDARRLGHQRVWIVDPLDGTREYAEGRGDWAVHVGLAIGGHAAAGAVAVPAAGDVFRSDRLGAQSAPHPGTPRVIVSRTRAPAFSPACAAALGAEIVVMGSAGVKAMAVVAGRAEIYLHAGGQYEWDNCAPVAVAAAHGLHTSRIDGAPLVYNRADPLVPDLLICRPEWAEQTLAALAAIDCG